MFIDTSENYWILLTLPWINSLPLLQKLQKHPFQNLINDSCSRIFTYYTTSKLKLYTTPVTLQFLLGESSLVHYIYISKTLRNMKDTFWNPFEWLDLGTQRSLGHSKGIRKTLKRHSKGNQRALGHSKQLI